MVKLSLCNYSDAYIFVKETVMVANTPAADADTNNANKKVIFKNCASFTDCISEINNRQIYNAKDLDVELPVHNLIKYSDNYSKALGSLWLLYTDEPALNNDGGIIDLADNNTIDSFKFKEKITGQTGNNSTKNVAIIVPLKYLSNFWRTLERPLINCEINLIRTWSANCATVYHLMLLQIKQQHLQ